ncbi:MAG: Wzz/FepE/Etk N-terminal domain-containing protein [Geodermatophilaceae bacterium]
MLARVDLRGQLTSMWLRRWQILAVALLVAFIVYVIRLLTPPTYEATTTVRVGVPSGAQGAQADTVAFYADTVVGLVGSDTVLSDAVRRTGLPISTRTAAERVVAAVRESPGFVEITATGPDPSAAVELADGTAEAVQARLINDEATALKAATADLQREIDVTEQQLSQTMPGPVLTALEQRYAAQLSALTDMELIDIQQDPGVRLTISSPATPPAGQASPVAWRDALFAFVVVVIVVAELLVLFRALRRRLSESEPAADVQRTLDVPAVALDPGHVPEAVLAPFYQDRIRTGSAVTVIDLTGNHGHRSAAALASTALLVGDPAVLLEVADGFGTTPEDQARLGHILREVEQGSQDQPQHHGITVRGLVPGPHNAEAIQPARPSRAARGAGKHKPVAVATRAVIIAARGGRLDGRLLRIVRDHPNAVVLAIDTARASRTQLQQDAAALRSVGANLRAVIIERRRTRWRDVVARRFTRAGSG